MSLNERLQLEKEILERLDRIRSLEEREEVAEDIEREILDRELAELEKDLEPEPALVLRKKRRA
jgi:5'-3' exonuclease